ncbi:MAG: C39 family peptidase [Candidatus Gracilibacteria bacterium]|nr:C39 family peptidase [Candidatus Gracilibacteria bacterium]
MPFYKTRKFISALIALILIASFLLYQWRIKFWIESYLVTRANQQTLQEVLEEVPEVIENVLPEKVYLEVPYTSQAPFANWDYLHENACEEAALIQVHYYLQGKELTPELAEQEIQDMVAWEIDFFGDHHDIYAEEMRAMAVAYYNYEQEKVRVIYDASIEDLKKELAAGNPIIAPITGHLLKNPYYHHPGYHMLTIIGYTSERFITNDVGTRNGKDFSYEYDRFMTALTDASGDVVVIES